MNLNMKLFSIVSTLTDTIITFFTEEEERIMSSRVTIINWAEGYRDYIDLNMNVIYRSYPDSFTEEFINNDFNISRTLKIVLEALLEKTEKLNLIVNE